MEIARTLKQTARALGRTRGLAVLAILTLGLGIGSTTFMFSIVHGALFRGLPFPDGDEILRVYGANPVEGWNRNSLQWPDFLAIRESQTSFQDLAAGYSGTVNISTGDRAIRISGGFFTANAFDILRVKPILGRAFRPGDDAPGAPQVLILSSQLWHDEFSGDPDVVGQAVRVNGENATIVGVMPEGFEFPELQAGWVSMRRGPTEERGTGSRDTITLGRMELKGGLPTGLWILMQRFLSGVPKNMAKKEGARTHLHAIYRNGVWYLPKPSTVETIDN